MFKGFRERVALFFTFLMPLMFLAIFDLIFDVLVRGKGIEALGVPAAVLIAFTLVIGFAASRVFSWEDS